MKVIYLEPHSAWRTELRSDTLWGLICWGVRYVWGEQQLLNLIAQFQSDTPPFLVTSAFPYTGTEDKRELWLPKPILKPFQLSDEEMNPGSMKAYQKYKKVSYMPMATFRALINSDLTEKQYFLQHREEWQAAAAVAPRKSVYVHNTIDRLHGGALQEGGLYNAPLFHEPPRGGLYFLLRIQNSEYESILNAIWTFFEHVGLGGDASIGRGIYKITVQEIDDFELNAEPNRFITLSLYSPTPQEGKAFSTDGDNTWYRLETRKGLVGGKLFVTNHILKQRLVMMAEGSSFPQLGKSNYGCLRLVKNAQTVPHKVYQYGYAFAVPSA